MGRGHAGRFPLPAVTLTLLVLAVVAWTATGVVTAVPSQVVRVSIAPAPTREFSTSSVSPTGPTASPAPSDPTLNWTELSLTQMPGPLINAGMVYDSTDHYVLLFGGEVYPSTLAPTNYTWSFRDGVWTNESGSGPAPSPREGMALADDPADGEVVLFGGRSATGIQHDTWTYAAGVWTNITSELAVSPPSLETSSMAYDNETGTVILFGGDTPLGTGTQYTNETWSFSDNTWTELTPTISPSVRASASMVYDASDFSLLLFGGLNETTTFNDTWEFVGEDWEQIPTTDAPNPRWGAGIAYYATHSEVVLYGGTNATNYSSTYTYHNGSWTWYPTLISPGQTLADAQMTYDYSDQYVVFYQDTFSGVNSTWNLTFHGAPAPPALTVTPHVTPLSGVAPLQVGFYSNVSGGTPPYTVTWNYDVDDQSLTGDTAVAGNTTWTYAAGTYNATLTVTDDASHSFTDYWILTVTSLALTLSIQATPTTATVNETVSFTATPEGGTTPYSYAWTFGDGATSTLQNPTHAYATAGKFDATLVVTDHVGDTVSKSVLVTVSTPGTTSSGSSDWWIYLVIGAILVVAAVLVLAWARRRRPPPNPPSSPSSTPPPSGGGPPG